MLLESYEEVTGLPWCSYMSGVTYLAHVKGANPLDCPAIVHHGRRLPLRLRQDDVDEVLVGRHDLDTLEVVRRHGSWSSKNHLRYFFRRKPLRPDGRGGLRPPFGLRAVK